MKLKLDLPYTLRPGDIGPLVELEELEILEGEARTQLKGIEEREMTPFTRDVVARRCQTALIASTPNLKARASARLLRDAINLRYLKETPKGMVLDMPRDKKSERNPGVWWGEIDEQLNGHPDDLSLPINQLTWLVEVWSDPKVQDGFEPSRQRFVNLMDQEMARVSELVKNPAAEVSAPQAVEEAPRE